MAKPLEINEFWLTRIAASVNGLEYGNVQIIVHDGRIVQIERTERKRFEGEASAPNRGAQESLFKLKNPKHGVDA